MNQAMTQLQPYPFEKLRALLGMRERLTADLRALAQHCVEVIAAGRLPLEQEKRYQVILGHLDL